METAFLIEPPLKATPDWWLSVETKRPSDFQTQEEEEHLTDGPGIHLILTYRWDVGQAHAIWDHTERSPILEVKAQGVPLFQLGPLLPGTRTPLPAKDAQALSAVLRSTSLLTVEIPGHEPALILVQEEGMAKKPSILLNLSIKDILRCWSSLTPEQKAVLLEERHQELAKASSALMPKAPLGRLEVESFFDAFAGIFHAFGALERRIVAALRSGRDKEVEYLLFGEKYDSLPRLVHRVLDEEKQLDAVTRYVILLCARQLLARAEKEAPPFRSEHQTDFKTLHDHLTSAAVVRDGLTFRVPDERARFFDWYERWFLTAVTPSSEVRSD